MLFPHPSPTLAPQVLNKLLSLAVAGASQQRSPKSWRSQMAISTASFARAVFTVTGKDMDVFMDQWVRMGGHARFTMEFVFNRKR